MIKSQKEMVQGVKYPGYGLLNEFNEFCFIPQETGARKGVKKCLVECKDYTIHYTRSRIIIHLSLDRKLSRVGRINRVIELLNNMIKVFKDYDF